MKFEEILQDLKNKIYKPIYFLMGEEPYFIDVITDYIAKHVLEEAEKSFNQIVLYGKDTNIADVINTAKRFPMMANYLVVILKEAQSLNDIDDLVYYAEAPLQSTILVVNYKYKNLDKRKKLYKVLDSAGVVFTSDKLYEDKIPSWINSYLSGRGVAIDLKASMLLTNFLGNELSKVVNELEKLILTLPKDSRTITVDQIERNIGISKDFNNFELHKALSQKNVLKANRIIYYFDKNQKSNPFSMTISSLYYFFSKVLMYHFIKDKSRKNAASVLRINPFFLADYELAARHYSASKVVQIIGLLREFDLKSKGMGNVSTTPGNLLKELTYKILH
ncbi:MAG: DNA polymerase III subunit delta [Bacteroidales bacterium]|nr:DNA polymerase III subunit delta [Bacteroidales bacterium]